MSHTTYVYSVGPSLVSVDVDIDDRHPDDIRAWPRVVLSNRGRIQALATHVDQALVYFSDTRTGAIYRTTRYEWGVAELTVQQPHVEGQLMGVAKFRRVSVGIMVSLGRIPMSVFRRLISYARVTR